MKAMVLKAPKTPLVLETVPDPVPGPGEVVAKVLACGAGLTIHHARAGRMVLKRYPHILGHEITAEGRAYLEANRPTLGALLARMNETSRTHGGGPAPQVLRAMENLRLALRLR